MIVNYELGRMWKATVVADSEVVTLFAWRDCGKPGTHQSDSNPGWKMSATQPHFRSAPESKIK
jgi:hypothetical protein